MSFDTVPEMWLPSREAVADYCSQNSLEPIKMPDNHVGVSSDPLLVETYVHCYTQGTINETYGNSPSATLVYALTGFYTGKPVYAIPAHIENLLISMEEDAYNQERTSRYLYLYSWRPTRATAVFSALKTIFDAKEDKELFRQVTHTELDKFLDVQTWFKDEGLTVPINLAWALREGSIAELTQIFTQTKGSTEEMLRLVNLKADWNVIETHFNARGDIPLDFFESLFGKGN